MFICVYRCLSVVKNIYYYIYYYIYIYYIVTISK